MELLNNIRRKILLIRFPFLKVRNVFSDEIVKNASWDDAMPKGWKKSFAVKMYKEMKSLLKKANYLNEYRITDLKEKYGTLHLYDNGVPESIAHDFQRLISKYEDISMFRCIHCGKVTKYYTTGWINYICKNCAKKFNSNSYKKLTAGDIPQRIYYTGDTETTEISQISEEMRKAWKD